MKTILNELTRWMACGSLAVDKYMPEKTPLSVKGALISQKDISTKLAEFAVQLKNRLEKDIPTYQKQHCIFKTENEEQKLSIIDWIQANKLRYSLPEPYEKDEEYIVCTNNVFSTLSEEQLKPFRIHKWDEYIECKSEHSFKDVLLIQPDSHKFQWFVCNNYFRDNLGVLHPHYIYCTQDKLDDFFQSDSFKLDPWEAVKPKVVALNNFQHG